MDAMMEALETVYQMRTGETVEFVSGVVVEMIKRDEYRVTDAHGKVYVSLSNDHAAMIAYKGE